jgi:hypothetical protein
MGTSTMLGGDKGTDCSGMIRDRMLRDVPKPPDGGTGTSVCKCEADRIRERSPRFLAVARTVGIQSA